MSNPKDKNALPQPRRLFEKVVFEVKAYVGQNWHYFTCNVMQNHTENPATDKKKMDFPQIEMVQSLPLAEKEPGKNGVAVEQNQVLWVSSEVRWLLYL